MTLTLESFNGLPRKTAEAELERCCGSKKWVEAMIEARPFLSHGALLDSADRIWKRLSPADWLEAFGHHPRIGARIGARTGAQIGGETAESDDWSGEEQKGTETASDRTRKLLVDKNRAYEERFGHVFLVCATGKSADEMLAILESRIGNEPDAELRIATAEHEKITRIRLEKLFK